MNTPLAVGERVHKKHWIIVSALKNAIWRKPYETYAQAKAEYDFQVKNLLPGQTKGDWQIEEMKNQYQHEQKIVSQVDLDFENFG